MQKLISLRIKEWNLSGPWRLSLQEFFAQVTRTAQVFLVTAIRITLALIRTFWSVSLAFAAAVLYSPRPSVRLSPTEEVELGEYWSRVHQQHPGQNYLRR